MELTLEEELRRLMEAKNQKPTYMLSHEEDPDAELVEDEDLEDDDDDDDEEERSDVNYRRKTNGSHP